MSRLVVTCKECGRSFDLLTERDEIEYGHDCEEPCSYCGGPADHGRDCLPASMGGTMPEISREQI